MSIMKNFYKSLLALLLAGVLTACSGGGAPAGTGEQDESGTETTEAEAVESMETENNTSAFDEVITSGIFPKGRQAKKIIQVTEPSSFSDKLLLASIQGQAAKHSDEQILIKNGAIDLYTPYIRSGWEAEVSARVNGKAATVQNLAEYYKDIVKGYILCDSEENARSVPVAISLAGVTDAVVATDQTAAMLDALGYECLVDVTGQTDSWLRESEYWDKLSRSVAFEQPASMAPKLVDYSILCGAYFTFYKGTMQSRHKEIYEFLDDGAVIFGYNNVLGEFDTVESFGEINLQMVPADHAYNLSTLSGFPLESLSQKRAEAEETPENVHTVCFMMSDGDNIQWVLNNFATGSEWYGNKKRGNFPMAWGVAPSSIDVMAPMLSYLYDNMTEKDEFVMQLSGVGYTFASRWDAEARRAMIADLAEQMQRCDTRYMEVLDDHGFTEELMADYTAQDGIDGLFYIEYHGYASHNGEIIWTNGKPAVSARHMLWADHADGTVDYLARQLNAASTDPTSEDAYSFVILHCWSGYKNGQLVPFGNTMDAVADLVSKLNDNVEVVTPSVFMERLVKNCGK